MNQQELEEGEICACGELAVTTCSVCLEPLCKKHSKLHNESDCLADDPIPEW